MLLFAAVAFAAICVHSFAGFGSALVAMPILTALRPPQEVLPAFTLMVLVLDVVLLLETRAHADWRRVAFLLAGAALGVPLGIFALTSLPAEHIRLGVNAVVLVFAIGLWLKVRLPLPDVPATRVLVGMTSGVLSGAVGTSGPPVVIFAVSQRWGKDVFRGTLLAYFTALVVMTLTGYTVSGLVDGAALLRALGALCGALPAAWIGVRLKRRTSEQRFERVVLVMITLMALLGLANQLRTWSAAGG